MKTLRPTHSHLPPGPFYSCADCADEYSWEADDIYYYPNHDVWLCSNCASGRRDWQDENEKPYDKAYSLEEYFESLKE